jgi:hypothetical protein
MKAPAVSAELLKLRVRDVAERLADGRAAVHAKPGARPAATLVEIDFAAARDDDRVASASLQVARSGARAGRAVAPDA